MRGSTVCDYSGCNEADAAKNPDVSEWLETMQRAVLEESNLLGKILQGSSRMLNSNTAMTSLDMT